METQDHSREIERHLQCLAQFRESLKSDENFSRYAYLTHEDLELLHDPDFYRDHDMSNSYQ